MADAAFATHQGAALATEQLSGQQIPHILSLQADYGRSCSCLKRCCTRSNKSWSTIAGMPPGVTMSLSGIRRCSGGCGRSGRSCSSRTASRCGYAGRARSGCCDLLSRFAVGVPGEDLLHDGSRLRVDMVQPVLLADGEAQRHHTTVILALEGIFALTARHFQGEARRNSIPPCQSACSPP